MLRIATCQMTSGPDLGANLQIAESLIRKAAREGANLALLPEMFTIMSNDPKDVLMQPNAIRTARYRRSWPASLNH